MNAPRDPEAAMATANALLAPLSRWMADQRWCSSDEAAFSEARVVAVIAADDLLDVAVAAAGPDGGEIIWHVPLVRAPDGPIRTDEGAWDDACAYSGGIVRLAALALGAAGVAGPHGELAGYAVDRTALPEDGAIIRPLEGEQSNSSALIDDRLVLKVFRRLEPGAHPEAELGRALASAGCEAVPVHRGALTLVPPDGIPMVAATVADAVADARDAWELAVAEAEAVARGAQQGGLLAEGAGALGRAIASVHLALAETLGTQPFGGDAAEAWTDAARARARAEMEALAALDHPVLERVLDRTDDIDAALAAGGPLLADAPACRVHGDLHLGQIIVTPDGDWRIIDFEGEPARPLAERGHPDTPLRDLAGMVRSVAYAAAAGARVPDADTAAVAAWHSRVRDELATAWREAVADAALVPDDPGTRQRLLSVRELDKAVYELGYERTLRPDWIHLPASGVLGILERLPPAVPDTPQDPDEVHGLLAGTHRDPHRVLGAHDHAGGGVVRVRRPDAEAVEVRIGATAHPCTHVADGLWEVTLPERPAPADYTITTTWQGGTTSTHHDGYALEPSVGELDRHLLAEGTHREVGARLGAHARTIDGVEAVTFAVWAPNARSVRVVGDFNSWDARRHPMRRLGTSGVWEVAICEAAHGDHYKFELVDAAGEPTRRADPCAAWAEEPPGTASRVHISTHEWGDADWRARRAETDIQRAPVSIYEVHLGSWRRGPDGQRLGYRELGEALADHVVAHGFTHVELLPPAEHPFGGSWGYQVTGFFAPTARFGDPDDFRAMVDHLHQRGIGVLVDWVPAHFPRDTWALARFDGTPLYEHPDPRRGTQPDWGTLVFDYGRPEVRSFLLSSALHWLTELGIDGLRVDAVASMLYLDYSRDEGEWAPNAHGGREHLEAVSLLRDLNVVAHDRVPGVLVVAEESTAWPGVTRPVHLGGLGFTLKWNMGWMHDTLDYFSRDPVHRRHHHDDLTFGLMYAWSEHYVLPLSHDEVVHGKGSLLTKMAGDRWQQLANLRAMYAWMWAHPGKQLVFMGAEIAQEREWAEGDTIDWHLLDDPGHVGIARLVGDLNAAYRAHPSLWARDPDPEAFAWIDADDADQNVASFMRHGRPGEPTLVCVANLSPVVRDGFRLGLPRPGRWVEALNTDSAHYGGSDVGNMGGVEATTTGWHDQPASALVTLPPLAVVWFAEQTADQVADRGPDQG